MATSKKPNKSKTVRMTLEEAVKQSSALKPGEKTARQLSALKDHDIDYSDIPQLTETFWRHLELLRPTPKRMMTLRLDDDVVDWFKSHGKGYQSEINAVLKAYVETWKTMDHR